MAVSAIWPGSVMPRSSSATWAAPRASRMFSTTARYSRASCMARSVAGGSSIGSISTQVAVPVPATPGPVQAAHDHRQLPVGQLAGVLDLGDGADGGVAAVDLGDEQQVAAGVTGGAGRRTRLGRL